MSEKVVFRLKRYWKIAGKKVNLYKAIKSGRKTSEYRDYTTYWERRLCPSLDSRIRECAYATIDVTKFLKPRVAWFTLGYPKDNLPRLEAKITKLIVNFVTAQFEVQFHNVIEIETSEALKELIKKGENVHDDGWLKECVFNGAKIK